MGKSLSQWACRNSLDAQGSETQTGQTSATHGTTERNIGDSRKANSALNVKRPQRAFNCSTAPAGHPCKINATLRPCYTSEDGVCTGEDFPTCAPVFGAVPDGTRCGDQRRCHQGRCVSQCERLGLSEDPPRKFAVCQCPVEDEGCSVCCYDPAHRGNIGETCRVRLLHRTFVVGNFFVQ